VEALHEALGIRIDEIPITPDKIVSALSGRYNAPRMPGFRYPETVSVPPLDASGTPTGAAVVREDSRDKVRR